MFAGASYTLNCTVVSDFRPVVKWMGLDGDPVDTNPANSDVTMDDPVYFGNKTYVLLRFRALRTSQAGQYTCQSVVNSPLSVRTATKNVVVTGKCSTYISRAALQKQADITYLITHLIHLLAFW